MRAGPLSNDAVVGLLNAHFVPAFVSNEDYEAGRVPPEEKRERDRIWREANEAGLSSGTVHAYILNPEGKVLDSRHVAKAAEPGETARLLEKIVKDLKVPAGEPAVKPASQCAPPAAPADVLLLHLTARGFKGASWDDFPAEDWIALERGEWEKLLPPSAAAAEDSWQVDRAVAAKILTRFYPQTENNDVSKHEFEEISLRATPLPAKDGMARARLEGRFKMRHDFYPGRKDGRLAEARIDGILKYDPKTRTVPSLALTTHEATYGPGTFAVAVRSHAPTTDR